MIKTLLTTLKQDKETFEVPKSVQDAIPIRRLWPDGIFQFGNKFSKTLRFSDINYAIALSTARSARIMWSLPKRVGLCRLRGPTITANSIRAGA